MMTAGDDWGADWGDAFNHLVTGCEWFLTWKMCFFFNGFMSNDISCREEVGHGFLYGC